MVSKSCVKISIQCSSFRPSHFIQALKTSDIVLDLDGKVFEAAIFISDWVFELNIGTYEALRLWLKLKRFVVSSF